MVGIGYEVLEAVPRIVRKSLAARKRGMTPLEPSLVSREAWSASSLCGSCKADETVRKHISKTRQLLIEILPATVHPAQPVVEALVVIASVKFISWLNSRCFEEKLFV